MIGIAKSERKKMPVTRRALETKLKEYNEKKSFMKRFSGKKSQSAENLDRLLKESDHENFDWNKVLQCFMGENNKPTYEGAAEKLHDELIKLCLNPDNEARPLQRDGEQRTLNLASTTGIKHELYVLYAQQDTHGTWTDYYISELKNQSAEDIIMDIRNNPPLPTKQARSG